MTTKEEVLANSTIDGNVLRLPDQQLDRKLYMETAKALELIGGKWKSGKIKGFVFDSNPQELLDKLLETSANGSGNVKKDYQYFPTPESVADYLVKLAAIDENHSILEPSAGQGALVKAINKLYPNKVVDCYEIMETNALILSKLPKANIVGSDFLNEDNGKSYDRIIANPPFSKNQDITHIYEMYKRLNHGGVIACITSTHYLNSNNKKESDFKNWLVDKIRHDEILDSGEFKESGTNISTRILVLVKE